MLSLALAGAPMTAPGPLTKAIGLRGTPAQRVLAMTVGGRELAMGVGLVSRPKRWMLVGRCLGDFMDIGLLTSTLFGRQGWTARGGHARGTTEDLPRTAGALAAVCTITVADIVAAVTFREGSPMVEAHATVTVGRDKNDVYHHWRRLENLPDFMAHLEKVEVTGRDTSRWVATAPFGRSVSWEARIIDEVPGERITWQSVEGSPVTNEGVVHFFEAPGQRGTEVHVTIRYRVPGGSLGRALARYFGHEPHQALDDDLRRFKQVMETGEIVRSDGAPSGKLSRHEFPQRPARPLSREELLEVVS